MPERSGAGAAAMIDAGRVAELIAREQAAYGGRHPSSRQAFAQAGANLLGGVPMTWMRMWPGGFPLYLAAAYGVRLTDIDGNEFVDFCLGDTGAMAGHSPADIRTGRRRTPATRRPGRAGPAGQAGRGADATTARPRGGAAGRAARRPRVRAGP